MNYYKIFCNKVKKNNTMKRFMRIYVVKIFDISKEKLDKLCLLIDSEKKYKIKRFINRRDKIRTLIGEIVIRTMVEIKL